jgi:hypothetical protein
MNINTAQWMWYFYNFMEDRKESFETRRDLVEYHASFIEPEAVRKIRESREESVEVPHEEFTAGIEYFFGRSIPITQDKKKNVESHSINPEDAVRMADMYKRTENMKKNIKKPKDYKYWFNMDLE